MSGLTRRALFRLGAALGLAPIAAAFPQARTAVQEGWHRITVSFDLSQPTGRAPTIWLSSASNTFPVNIGHTNGLMPRLAKVDELQESWTKPEYSVVRERVSRQTSEALVEAHNRRLEAWGL